MKTRVRYYWLCTFKTVAGEKKTVIIGDEKTNSPKYFSSPERARTFLRRAGLVDNMLLGEYKCELKAVEV